MEAVINPEYNRYILAAFFLIFIIWLIDAILMGKKGKISTEQNPAVSRQGMTGTFLKTKGALELLIFGISFLILFLLNGNKHIFYNNYSYLADALLHGHLDVPDMPEYLESVEFAGHRYMHFAPGPSILCIPFVALFGTDGFNAGILCMFLGAANSVLIYKVLCNLKIGITVRDRLWFTAFATFGTVHLFLAAVAHSWFFGQVSTWFFLLFAMYLVTKPCQKHQDLYMLLTGFLYGMAVTCRLSNLLGGLFFFGYIWIFKPEKIRSLLFFCIGAVVPGGLYMIYNYARFGTILDKGYNLTHLKDYFREQYDAMQELPTKKEQLAYLAEAEKTVGGPLQPRYIAYNLYSIFLMMPEFKTEYPFVIPLQTGVSLTAISPALYFFVSADWRKRFHQILLATMAICAVPFLLNYGNGMSQFGMRYAMDFLPYMILLACMGMKTVGRKKTLFISFCIFANIWGPIYWRFFYLQ